MVQLIADSAGEPGPELLTGTGTDRIVPTAAVATAGDAAADRSAGGAWSTVGVCAAEGVRTTAAGRTATGPAAWTGAAGRGLADAATASGARNAEDGLAVRMAAACPGLSLLLVRLGVSELTRGVRVRFAGRGLRIPEEAESALEEVESSAGAASATPGEPVAAAAPMPRATARPPTRPITPAALIQEIVTT